MTQKRKNTAFLRNTLFFIFALSFQVGDATANDIWYTSKTRQTTDFTLEATDSNLTYKEDGVPTYTQNAFIAKLIYDHTGSALELGVEGFATVAELSKSSDSSARILGISTKIGPVLKFSNQMSLSLPVGYSYTTMMVTADQFGYKNLAGPQAVPTLRLRGSKAMVSLYGRVALVSNSVISFSDGEIGTGIIWTPVSTAPHPVSIALEGSNLRVTLNGIAIRSTTLYAGLQFGIF